MEILLILVLAFGGYKFFSWARSEQQAEHDRAARLEGERYDRIVNCPTCEGSGECWMDHRVSSEGHIFTKPERRADIERGMDENFKQIRPESYYHVDSYGTSYSYKRGVCPHCEGAGTAYARFETVPESEASCQACSGRGVITQTVKGEVGVDKVQVQCPSCAGSGQTIMPQIQKVHVRCLSQSVSQTFNLASFEPSNFFDVSKPRFGSDVG